MSTGIIKQDLETTKSITVQTSLVVAADGTVFLNLPTEDPEVAGQLWADSLTVKVSAGA